MKRLSLLFTFALVAVCMFAQESNGVGRKATFVRNGFWDNWFVGIGGGVNYYLRGNDSNADFLKMLTPAATIQVGKWYNPYFGARLKAQGGPLKSFSDKYTSFYPTSYNNKKDITLKNYYVSGEADLMWNLFNYFGKYKENRFYSLIPYIGVGFGYGWHNEINDTKVGPKQRNFTLNGGIINKFQFSKRVGLDIDLSAALLKEGMDLDQQVGTYDGLLAASASLVFKVGKVGFQEAELKDQSLIDDLNNQINRLRAENAELSKRPVSCPKCPEAPAQTVTKSTYVPNVVFFRLNSSTIDKNQEISIYNTAEYLKNNPSAKVKVVAYADKKTGTAAYNEKLSEKRAKNVANALINQYNIDSNRVSVDWKGSSEQPYTTNEWNRVAIFIAD